MFFFILFYKNGLFGTFLKVNRVKEGIKLCTSQLKLSHSLAWLKPEKKFLARAGMSRAMKNSSSS
jgi:hypothetical protein